MSEHVIQNPVPTPEQMAEMLGVSPERVKTLRGIMKSPPTGFFERRHTTSVTAMKTTSASRKAVVVGKGKAATRAKTKAR